MAISSPVNTQNVASVQSFVAVSDETGNSVIYAQQYASNGTKIGAAIQVTPDSISATPQSTLLLSDGKFVVAYNYTDPNDTSTPYPYVYLASEEIAADGSKIATNFLGLNDFDTSEAYKSTALGGGTYGYLLETVKSLPFGGYEETKTFGFVDAAGQLKQTVLARTGGGDGPYPILQQSAGSITIFPDGHFSVGFTEAYSNGNPDFPSPIPVPSGQQQYNRVYTGDGALITDIFVDFDGTKTVARYDAGTGIETGSVVFNTDGSRFATQYGITGRYYVEQSIATDSTGAITEQKRYYGDARHTLAFSQTNSTDGTSEVHNYDTSGREIVRQVGNLRAEHDVFQFGYADPNATVPTTTTLTHYGSGGTKSFTDITTADGSHLQTSYATGVTLTSHQAVADTFIGYASASDAFIFQPAFGKDVVKGFSAGSGSNHDVLRFDDRLVSDFTALAEHISQVGSDTLISFETGDSILLKGVASSALTAENVQFVHHDVLLL